jgi:hypothetical protein
VRNRLLISAAIMLATIGMATGRLPGNRGRTLRHLDDAVRLPARHLDLDENRSFTDIIGSRLQAPYINSLAASCGLATDYHNTTHPSLPNYLAATSGIAQGSLPATT